MNILLVAGGWSGEREVSLRGAAAIETALSEIGHTVSRFDPFYEMSNLINKAKRSDFVFINLHGSPGEDGIIQCLLELHNIPFQGSGSKASMLALNKFFSKQVLAECGVSTLPHIFIPRGQKFTQDCSFPIVIKPNNGGSSVGVFIVKNCDEAEKAILKIHEQDDALIEKYQLGIEITCGVLGDKALAPILIRPKSGVFFDYESKYIVGGAEELCPAPISDKLTYEVQEITLKVHKKLGLLDYSRADFILDSEEHLWFLEVNTLPGMTATSLLPQEAKVAGYDFQALLSKLIELGLNKKR